MLVEAVGLGVLFLLAFGNGANDAGKSIAPLMIDPGGTGWRPSRRALIWGGLFTGLGSVSAILISTRLLSVFTPENLLQTTPGSAFILAALIGAALWVVAATLLRLPVSTTHAILGAVLLQAVYLYGTSNLDWALLTWRILLPLVAGPFAALLGVAILDRLIRRRRAKQDDGSGRVGKAQWASSAATAYARGVNDAPKMVALGVFFVLTTPVETFSYLVVAVAVVMGSLVWGDRVAKTVLGRTQSMEQGQKVKAGIATAALLSAGAYFGDAFSATQVSESAAAGGRGSGWWGSPRTCR